MSSLFDTNINDQRALVEELVKELQSIAGAIGHNELEKTISDLRNRITEPFMFVIVGEVKAGKSSFINALLDPKKEICKVAPQPMTDTIQQIVYGEKESITTINPYLKRIQQPVEILKEVAIVDTPGTNTIAEHHQEITESFIPASDLIVFVFESKNPYRQSSWDFFDFIHKEWHRKIIFVLQQKDLVKPDDLEVNIKGVQDYAIKKGIPNPNVFTVSALQEIQGQTEESGFKTIKKYIADNITGGKAPFLKLQNNINTSRNINERIYNGLKTREEQWKADCNFREDIKLTLASQAQKSNAQVDILVENLVAAYDKITLQKEQELDGGLGLFSIVKRSFTSIYSKKKSVKDWLQGLSGELETDLNNVLKQRLDKGVVDIADSIQQMAKMIDLKIKSSDTILRNDHDLFSDIAEKRINILRDLQDTFREFMDRSENFSGDGVFGGNEQIVGNVTKGAGVAAVIGIFLQAFTTVSVIDITGGVLTGLGALFAGGSIVLQKRKILEGYREEVTKGRIKIEGEVSDKLKNYIQNIKEKIDHNFNKFDQLIQDEEKQIKHLNERHNFIDQQLNSIESKIEIPS